jgi:hypothetical protein
LVNIISRVTLGVNDPIRATLVFQRSLDKVNMSTNQSLLEVLLTECIIQSKEHHRYLFKKKFFNEPRLNGQFAFHFRMRFVGSGSTGNSRKKIQCQIASRQILK